MKLQICTKEADEHKNLKKNPKMAVKAIILVRLRY